VRVPACATASSEGGGPYLSRVLSMVRECRRRRERSTLKSQQRTFNGKGGVRDSWPQEARRVAAPFGGAPGGAKPAPTRGNERTPALAAITRAEREMAQAWRPTKREGAGTSEEPVRGSHGLASELRPQARRLLLPSALLVLPRSPLRSSL